MATLNEIVAFQSGSWSPTDWQYRVFSITNGVVQLRLWNIANAAYHSYNGVYYPHAIEFDTSTGIWSDPNTIETPNVFSTTLNGTRLTSLTYPTTIFGWDSTTQTSHRLEFDTPLWAQSSGGGTGSEGVPVYDMNKDRLLISGLSHGTYQLNASFGNGDVWTFTVPTTQSYTLYADSSDASPANVDSLDKFSPGIYWLINMGGFQLATLTVSSNKKVFSNFW